MDPAYLVSGNLPAMVPKTIDEARAIIAERGGMIVPAALPARTDLRFDRLLLGPATGGEVAAHTIGYTGTPFRLPGGGEHPGGDLGAEEALWLPADQDAHHRGGLQGLADVVSRLLDPVGGCPWDVEQTHASLKKYLLEEVYELIAAIDLEDTDAMSEELGDVLLQPLMHAEIARRAGGEGVDEIGQRAAEKLVFRHPHVFGGPRIEDAGEVLRQWDRLKMKEREAGTSLLSGIPVTMPALGRALAISKRAARVGFEWQDLPAVFAKLDEELAELRDAREVGSGIAEELGDVLFTVVNIARWLDVDPEDALRQMLDRFTCRFQRMESTAGADLASLRPDDWDRLWVAAKAEESGARVGTQLEGAAEDGLSAG